MKYKDKYIIANWKSNVQTITEAEEIINKGLELGDKVAHYTVSAPFIYPLSAKYSPVIGSQSVSQYEGGSHTGLYTAQQTKNAGATFTLLGHSEERARGMSDADINLSIENALKQDLYVCLCIGERVRETSEIEIKKQIDESLNGLEEELNTNKIMLAYEPVWAIGSGALRPATDSEIIETVNFIKNYIKTQFNLNEETKIICLYGGSVDSTNIENILNLETVDGILIGRASSDLSEWSKVVDTLK
jgi:triosephosphate isomerase (TIM)